MKEMIIYIVLEKMRVDLTANQMGKLHDIMSVELNSVIITEKEFEEETDYRIANRIILHRFITAKQLQGLSQRTINSYRYRLGKFLAFIDKPLRKVSAEDIRDYFMGYKKKSPEISNSALENIRLTLSSFYSWLSAECIVYYNPIIRIPKFKIERRVRKPFTEEEIELMRLKARSIRDLAILETLYSTGMRISELESLDRDAVDLDKGECIVYGKGAKERIVYFNAKALVHLKRYLKSRHDNNPALFVGSKFPYKRLRKSCIEAMIRNLGKDAGVENAYPHRFRRTMATNAINRGMPIQEVRDLMGHSKVDTTMIYCNLYQDNIKLNHKKYIT